MVTINVFFNGYVFLLNGKDMSIKEIKETGFVLSQKNKDSLIAEFNKSPHRNQFKNSFQQSLSFFN